MDKKQKIEIEIKALPEFLTRRFITLAGLTKKQFKALKSGDTVKIPKEAFFDNLYERVKHGDS